MNSECFDKTSIITETSETSNLSEENFTASENHSKFLTYGRFVAGFLQYFNMPDIKSILAE
jgi:hypothetical protein